jgi:VanZ family protein
MKNFYWWVVLFGYGALIFYVSSLPAVPAPAPPLFMHQDKLSHGLEYLVFGWFALKAFVPGTMKGVFGTLVFTILYAASDELHQSFVPGRCCSLWDWIADSIGILSSFFIYRYRYKYRHIHADYNQSKKY